MRNWTCDNGHHLDRDVNAAINIQREGQKIHSAGTVENTGGETVRPQPRLGQVSVKPEAHQSLADGQFTSGSSTGSVSIENIPPKIISIRGLDKTHIQANLSRLQRSGVKAPPLGLSYNRKLF